MKGLFIALLFMCLCVVINAQLLNLADFIHQSAITPENQILLRIYSVPEVSSFQVDAVALIGGEHVIESFQTENINEQKLTITKPDADLPQIAFRAEETGLNLVIPWQVSTAQAAQKLYYVRAGTSAEGIVTGTADGNTDLRAQSFSLSDATLNVMLENASGSYPSSIFPSAIPYIYGVLLINADRLLELEIDLNDFDISNIDPAILTQIPAYAMLYASLMVVNSGVFKLPLSAMLGPDGVDVSALLNLTSVGNITSSIDTGALLLRVGFSTLTSDADFGMWPNLSGCLIGIPLIIHANNLTSQTPTIDMDISSPTLIYCNPYPVRPQTNTTVSITTGDMTPLIYEINYSSPGGFYPYSAKFTTADQQVILPISTSMNFTSNATFYFTSTTPLGDGTFSFTADNEHFTTLNYVYPLSLPVTNLTATVEDSDVVLSWTAPDSDFVVGYKVYRNNILLISLPATATSHRDSNLTTGTYTYGVAVTYPLDVSEMVYASVVAVSETDIVGLAKPTTLYANYPNPFNPTTTIAFEIAVPSYVTVDVYNIKGQKVKTLINAMCGSGRHSLMWNGDDDSEQHVGSGVYFYRMTVDGYTSVRKMLLMK